MRDATTVAVIWVLIMGATPVSAQARGGGDEPASQAALPKQGNEPAPPAAAKKRAEEPTPATKGKGKADSDEPAPPAAGGKDEPRATGTRSGDEPGRPGTTASGDANEPTAPPKAVAAVRRRAKPPMRIGVGVHSRIMFLPHWLLGVGFDQNTQMTSAAVGAEVVFRRGTFDIVGSIDVMFHSPADGNFLGAGKNPATETDYLHFDNLNFLGFTVHFIKHHPILPWMSFVWGGGVGIGITLGSIYHVSAGRGCDAATAGNEALCVPDSASWDPRHPSAWMDEPANHGVDGDTCPADQKGQGLCDDYNNPKRFKDGDMWPVVPTVHLLAGLDFKLSDHFGLRVDGGFRHLSFYVGATGHYFF